MRQAVIDAAGGRTTLFSTECGLEIAVMRTPEKTFKMTAYFQSSPVDLARYKLCESGAIQLGKEIGRLYADVDHDYIRND